jgi:hypothetical protein
LIRLGCSSSYTHLAFPIWLCFEVSSDIIGLSKRWAFSFRSYSILLLVLLLVLTNPYFPPSQQRHKVVNRKSEAYEKCEEVSRGVYLGAEVSHSGLGNDEQPGEHEGSHHVNQLTVDELPLAMGHQLANIVFSLAAQRYELKKCDGSNVDQEKYEGNYVAWNEIRRNLEEQCFLSVNFFCAQRRNRDGNSHERENARVDLFVEEGEVVVELFGDGEVEEDVEAAHGEVVDEAQEVDGEGERGADGDCGAGDIRSESQRRIDKVIVSCLSLFVEINGDDELGMILRAATLDRTATICGVASGTVRCSISGAICSTVRGTVRGTVRCAVRCAIRCAVHGAVSIVIDHYPGEGDISLHQLQVLVVASEKVALIVRSKGLR